MDISLSVARFKGKGRWILWSRTADDGTSGLNGEKKL